MNAALSSSVDQQRPAWWAVVGRWLLFLLVTLDLISSPFHAHSHDVGGSGEFHLAHVNVDRDHEDEIHIEAPDAHHVFGHSLTVLLPAEMPRLASQTLIDWFVHPTLAVEPAVKAVKAVAWTAIPDHIPILGDIHWRPVGRAPPLLHA